MNDKELYKFFYHWIMALNGSDERAKEFYGKQFIELFRWDGGRYDLRAQGICKKAYEDFLKHTHGKLGFKNGVRD